MSDLAFQSAVTLARKIRDRSVGCVELLDHFLARVERFNPPLNAIIVLDAERARARARDADGSLARGEVWGPLHGVPMTIKESYDVAGLPTTWGLERLKDNVPETNAVVVDRMLKAGVVLFGKTNVPVLLSDWQTYNPVYGTTRNPWDTERTPGGSSGGGSAALAAGLTGIESGSDIGASIRNPAHYCGVYGHKPTWGIVPSRGQATPGILTMSDIGVVGPLARSAEDLAVALEAVSGADTIDAAGWRLELPPPRRKALKDYRVAVMLSHPEAEVDTAYTDRIQAVADAVAKTGAHVSDTARPHIDFHHAHAVYMKLLRGVTTARQPQEVFDACLKQVAEMDPTADDYKARNARATVQYHRQWVAANEERTHLRWRWHEFFQDYDILLCPTAAGDAFPIEEKIERPDRTVMVNGKPQNTMDQLFWAGITSVVYLPSTVAPAGLSRNGLPTGVQIVAAHLEDRTCIDVARHLADEMGGFVPPPGYD